MSNAQTPPAAEQPADTPSETAAFELPDLPTAAVLAAMAKVNAETAAQQQADVRALLAQHLAAQYAQTKSKSVDIVLPNGRKIGAATIPTSSDATTVVDQDALAEWLGLMGLENALEVKVTVRPAFVKALDEVITWMADPDYVAPQVAEGEEAPPVPLVPVYTGTNATAAGQVVPGLAFRKGVAKPEAFSITFVKPKKGAAKTEDNQADGRELVASFMATNSLESLLGSAMGEAPSQITA